MRKQAFCIIDHLSSRVGRQQLNRVRSRHVHKLCRAHVFASLCLILAPWGNAAGASTDGFAYPSKPLRLVVPYAPGGGGDLVTRMIGAKLTEAWGQPVVNDNRPGGGTTIGTDLVAKASPDGYTILFATTALAVNESLYETRPYDLMRELSPVTLLIRSPNVLLVHPSVQSSSLSEFIALAKAKPGQLNYGSSGNGGTGHLAMEMLKAMVNIDLVHVPYKGGGPALLALRRGEVTALFNNIIAVASEIKAGRLRALGVTSTKRSPAAPDVPTIAEAGVPGFEATPWFGFFVPSGTPRGIITKLNSEIVRILKMPDILQRFASQGAEPVGNSPEEFAEVIRSDILKWRKVIKAARIAPG